MRNVLAAAWSADGLLAFVTRAAWRGPKNLVHVVDAANGFAPVAKLEIDGDPERDTACLVFLGERLLAHVGGPIVMWNARTGEELDRERIQGWIFALYPDGSVGVNSKGLGIVSLVTGSMTRLGFAADWLTPIDAPKDDWVVTHENTLRRVAPAGTVRWSVPLTVRPNALGAGAKTVLVGSNVEKKVWLFDAETGQSVAVLAAGADIASCGALPDGTVWFMEYRGRLAFHNPDGTLVRETSIDDVLCMRAVLSPDASMVAVTADLLELRSCLRVASTTTGEILWESKARANKAPAARSKGGPVLTAKDGNLLKKGTKEPLGTYTGEVMLAMSKDGALAIVADADDVRVLDVESGKVTIRHSRAKLEEDTISEVVDKVVFDAEGRPCVKIERHTFVVETSGFVGAAKAKAKGKAVVKKR